MNSTASSGYVIAGKYELIRLLGRGSMGEVWTARHRTLGEDVAVKLLGAVKDEELEDPSIAAARFQFEARIAARLSRKTRHIVSVTDHGEENGIRYLVMELLDGQTLERRLLSRGTMSPAEVAQIVGQIGRALEEAHADGIVHRDLKPANVFITRDEDDKLLVKLLDFGIARTIQAHRVERMFATARGLVFGTPGYLSPEQARACSIIDQQCDLWALATLAYEALTGDLPVAGVHAEELLANVSAGRIVPLHARNPELPAALAGFFQRAFAETIAQRYPSATALAQAFEQAVGNFDQRVDARTASGPRPSPPVSELRPWVRSSASPLEGRARSSVLLFGSLGALFVIGAATWVALSGAGARSSAAAAAPATAAAMPVTVRQAEAPQTLLQPLSDTSAEYRAGDHPLTFTSRHSDATDIAADITRSLPAPPPLAPAPRPMVPASQAPAPTALPTVTPPRPGAPVDKSEVL